MILHQTEKTGALWDRWTEAERFLEKAVEEREKIATDETNAEQTEKNERWAVSASAGAGVTGGAAGKYGGLCRWAEQHGSGYAKWQ